MDIKIMIPLVVVAIAAVAVSALKKSDKNEQTGEKIRSRGILTEREKEMYALLVQTFPEFLILTQVAFSALVTAKSRTVRNTFDRKVVDFLICEKNFSVIAAIELDDSSHSGREKEDETRGELLTDAGYKLLRFRTIPKMIELRVRVLP